jgi:exo-1,4-beta-D-glucosaminidase
MSRLRNFAFLILSVCVLGAACSASADETPRESSRTYLHKSWQLQSSCEIKATGDQISIVGFDASAWHKTDVPATVVGALVTDKTYPDQNVGTNLKKLPGTNYPDMPFFALQDMPEGSPFKCSWWYRTEFTVPQGSSATNEWLNFLGINYRANIWVNGQKFADAKETVGTYRTFEFNVTKLLQPGKPNALAVEIFAPGKDDLGITWVDWNPTPPDKDMGIWKEVFLTSSADVALRNAFVASKLDREYKSAALTMSADLRNASDHPVKGVLVADFEGAKLSQSVELAAGETKNIKFAPEKFAELRLAHPKLWWPYQMGEPHLYTAKLAFEIEKKISDSATVSFGIREVKSELTAKNHLLFTINGRKVLIRGAAWAPDMLFRWSSSRLDTDLAYVRDMGMNTIRLEGRLDRDEFFDKTDRLGILVMPGWTCCDAWEVWDNWKGDQKEVAAASLTDQITRLRTHPSVFVWLNGSDNPPPDDIEKMYLGIEKKLEWPNPVVSSAGDTKTKVTGDSGVKMTGPYEYVPPVYWLTDTEAGGAYGYNTETSPGPAVPTRQSLEKFIPKEHLWPIDDVWNFHAGKERFTTINVFTDGLNRRYGTATSLDDYLRKAQAVTYDGQRAMFEAYGRNKYTATGVIQWMLNNGWPSLIWHLYDYYLVPGGGYFGTKKACEPVHVQYSYDDNSVAVVNSTYDTLKGMKVSAKIYNLDASEKGTRETTLTFAPDSATKAFELPKIADLSKTYFLRLQLHGADGKLVSDNFYWLSTKPDTLDWKNKQDTVYTPQAEFGDLTGLNSLPQVKLETAITAKTEAEKRSLHITLKNPSKSVAFMVHLRMTKGSGGDDLVPVFWDDNYFSLVPGESKGIEATFNVGAADGKEPVLEVDGFNVAPATLNTASH